MPFELSVGEVAALINVGLVFSKLFSDYDAMDVFANTSSTNYLPTLYRLHHCGSTQEQD